MNSVNSVDSKSTIDMTDNQYSRLTLREKLKLPTSCSDQKVTDVCNKYYLIYKNVYDSSQNEQVKKIAKNRIADLLESAKKENINISYESNIVFVRDDSKESCVELMFNNVDSNGNLLPSEVRKIEEQINNLPESARKYYFKSSFVKNTKSMSLETCREMLSLLSNARKQDPSNFVYNQIIGDIEKSVNKYNSALEAWKKAEQERIQHEKNIAITKKVFGAIGKIILVILGAIGAAIAGLFALCCESCDC